MLNDISQYIDLYIQDNDFLLNSGNEPTLCNNTVSISQDIKHAIIESGLALQLIAERSPTLRADIFNQIILLVEHDVRIIPGTVSIKEEQQGRFLLLADTYDFGTIYTAVSNDK